MIYQKNTGHKGLLLLLPFWTPQIPPMGISCLKSYLEPHGFIVRTADANTEPRLRELYNIYFDRLRNFVSADKRGNFYNIGHDVLQNQMMGYINHKNETEYLDLVKSVIENTYYVDVSSSQVRKLDEIIKGIYTWLEEYLAGIIIAEDPAYLGLSVYRGNLAASLFGFRLTRERYPHIRTIMGGAVFAQGLNPGTPDFDYFLRETRDYIDHIVIGEGELLFLNLLKGELPHSQRVISQDDLPAGRLAIDTAPVPDFSDLDIDYYPNLAAYTARSCPFQCHFCSETVYWGKYRKKSVTQVVEELTRLQQKYGSQLFLLTDSLLNPVITPLASQLANSPLSLYWDGYLRVDRESCDPAKVLLWRRGGFYRARIGVETGSEKILQAMNKHISLRDIKRTISNLANTGIKVTTYWVIGYPGETEADFQQTLDLVEELRDDIFEAECNPFGYYPGGQVNSDQWAGSGKSKLLYPPDARHMLVSQTWILDTPPSRQEVYQRINRFVRHTANFGIANPYSLYDISQADARWKNLHKNAVPSLLSFKNKKGHIDEAKTVQIPIHAGEKKVGDLEFDF